MVRRQPPPPPSPAAGRCISDRLLAWYDRHARVLPWRARPGEASDPYAVWLSEIMLQQTTVQAVKPYFAKFLAAWPTVEALAAAPLDDVMRAWAGLGYYSRARNLHRCAQIVAERHSGCFPSEEAGLRALPGIGAYTAAAIAAIAFCRPAVVVDGNVERVTARLHEVDTPLPQARGLIRARVAEATPALRAGDFAQAMMDLGATICTPRNPACAICPLLEVCAARRAGTQLRYPVKSPKRERPTRFGTAYAIRNGAGDILLRTRPEKGLLGNMAELPGSDWVAERAAQTGGSVTLGTVEHGFTHFALVLDVVERPLAPWGDMEAEFGSSIRWVKPGDLPTEALPTLMRKAVAVALAGVPRLASGQSS